MTALLAVVLALLVLTVTIVVTGRAIVSCMKEQAGVAADSARMAPLLPPRLDASGDPVHGGSEWERLSDRLDKLTLAVSDGIERVSRAENRIQKTVTSARRLVRDAGLEHAGIDAEHAELQPSDGEGVEPLPAVPEAVAQGRIIRIPGGNLRIGA